ncbi:Vacuolar protein sorting-associated protein 35 [Pichia californica]|uniref:Vacuolar protein sorting-associated protein 35 n=1 Tax=Pichia californica TaxID=460514 RepID=A0A9P7BES6_9ASCO|nr:Vacuolar protein sorting-associated protein 35 [[Candida] californica]
MSKINKITIEEQQKLLDNSILLIKNEIYQMRKCLESKHKFMDSLKHASNFLNELRTNSLNPKQYYELYILIYDGLNYLSSYLKDNNKDSNNNTYLIDLYELVQYAGNIIPRLYLMITIGSVYMSREDAPINEILNDMLEMCKGVQNPIRGLFLRYYLIQKTKNYLINFENSENLNKILNFIILNFIEMNKLWVRLQHQGHSTEKDKRIEERKELKILVGSNLVILSQLDLITKELYNDKVLPDILQQIIKCKDSIAQNYLLDVIIQIFPDTFQVFSLKTFLISLLMINNDDVNITLLLNSLIERLIDYKKRSSNSININSSFLNILIEFIEKLNEIDPNFNIKNYCIILNGILKLSLIYSKEDDDVLNNLNLIYKLSIDKFIIYKNNNDDNDNNDKDINDFKIILKSIENFDDFNNFFKINDDNYFKLFDLQNLKIKKEIGLLILNNIIDNEIKIENLDNLNMIFKYLNESILIDNNNNESKTILSETKKDLFGELSNENNTGLEIIELDIYYETLCKFLHLIYNKDSKSYYKLLIEVEAKLNNKGNYYKTYPTLISILIKLIRKMNFEKIDKKELVNIFNKISKLINNLKDKMPIKSMNLNLNCAQISNECILNNISYEFFIESFIIYEENIIESKIQIQCLMNIINKLISMDQMIILDAEDFNKLITKATLYGSRLLKKTDQCRAIYNSSHLWWINKDEEEEEEAEGGEEKEVSEVSEDDEDNNQISLKKDNKRVLECLQKSLRIADSIMDNNVSIELFIEILNQSIYYFIHGNEMINVRYLNGLIELIGNNFKEVNQTTSGEIENSVFASTWKHYQRTLKYIKEQRAVDGRFHEIAI